jgi:hypothetical protein
MATPQAADELDHLMSRLEEGLHGTSAGFKRNGVLVCGLFFVMAIAFAVKSAPAGVVFCAIFGVAIGAIVIVAVRRNSPEKMRPVVDAVRTVPERIKAIRHYQTSDSRRVFVTDWLRSAPAITT